MALERSSLRLAFRQARYSHLVDSRGRAGSQPSSTPAPCWAVSAPLTQPLIHSDTAASPEPLLAPNSDSSWSLAAAVSRSPYIPQVGCGRKVLPMGKKLADVLEQAGMPLHFQAGGAAPEELVEREVKQEPGPRAQRLRELYYQTLSSATNESSKSLESSVSSKSPSLTREPSGTIPRTVAPRSPLTLQVNTN